MQLTNKYINKELIIHSGLYCQADLQVDTNIFEKYSAVSSDL
jgi:hypothetical protein